MISGAVRQTLLLGFTTSRSQGGGCRCRATCFDVFFLKVRLRGRPLLAEGVTGVWSGTGSLVTGVGFHQDSAWLLLQPTLALGQCGAPVHEHTPTPAVKCTSLATRSNVLQQPRRAWPFSAHARPSQCHRGGRLRRRHPRRGVLGEAAKTSDLGRSSRPPRPCGAKWLFAESKTVCGRTSVRSAWTTPKRRLFVVSTTLHAQSRWTVKGNGVAVASLRAGKECFSARAPPCKARVLARHVPTQDMVFVAPFPEVPLLICQGRSTVGPGTREDQGTGDFNGMVMYPAYDCVTVGEIGI